MTPEEYHLLRAARPSGGDEADPAVRAARAAAAADPVSAAQLQRELELDQEMTAAMANVAPPAYLENAILTAMRAGRGLVVVPPTLEENVLSALGGKHPHPARRSRRRWLGWATAAAAGLAVSVSYWQNRANGLSMRRLREELAAISNKGLQLGLRSMDRAAVAGWLDQHGAPRALDLPDKLAALPRKGCQLYHIEDHPVGLECFLFPDMSEIHLFCTPTAGLAEAPPEGGWTKLQTEGNLTLATWTRRGLTMLLYTHQPLPAVSALLS